MYRYTATGMVERLADGAVISPDPDNRDYAAALAWVAQGNTIAPAPAPDLQAEVVTAVQRRLDAFFQTRGYDGVLSARTYATSGVPKFRTEGQYAVDASDACWVKCYEILGGVEAGQRPVPRLEEVMAEMPSLEWPQ